MTVAELDPNVAKGAIEQTFEALKDRARGGGKRSATFKRYPGGAASESRSPAHGRGLASGSRGLADIRPGRARVAQPANGVDNGVVEELAELQKLAELVGVAAADSMTAVGHEARQHRQVGGGLNVARTAAARHGNECKPTLHRMRYFWWAEFQKRGALHYHAIVLDPPFAAIRDARHWFDKTWRSALPAGVFRTQCYVEFRSSSWFRKSGGDYVLKDLRKLNGKAYEQEYSRMPAGWRTFRSHQLTFTAAEHQEHESKAWTVCTADAAAPWHQKTKEIFIYRVDHHCPQDGGCRLTQRKARGRKQQDVAGSRKNAVPTGIIAQVTTTGAIRIPAGHYTWDVVSPEQGYARPRFESDTTGDRGLLQPTTGCIERPFLRSLDVTAAVLATPSGDQHERGRHMTRSRARS